MAAIVVGYDGSPASEPALEEAAAEAERRSAELTVVHAFRSVLITPPPFEMPIPGYSAHDAALRLAGQAADRIRADHPGLTVRAEARHGLAPAVLAERAADADLLVVGHRGHGGFPGLELGSVALRSVTRSPVPTLVVRGGRPRPRGTVLVAVDLAEDADEIVDFAFSEAALRGVRLTMVSAWDAHSSPAYAGDPGRVRYAADPAWERADAALARRLRPWRDKYPGVVAEHKLADGEPATVLVAATSHADLVVIGIWRPDGHNTRPGPIAQTVLRYADCPVAVVPHG
ncbi:universal stress protein [Catenulispora subtropica]|uniref:Universal stress protein n=1 Tax=Catenulispora subtropica TaxID=450798 RepID=A0ABN2RLR2_9ACTN